MTVLSEEQMILFCSHPRCTIDTCAHANVREIENAVVAALAAGCGDDETLSEDLVANHNCIFASTGVESPSIYSRALFALAAADARHAEREAMWRELDSLMVTHERRRELRLALGLEG